MFRKMADGSISTEEYKPKDYERLRSKMLDLLESKPMDIWQRVKTYVELEPNHESLHQYKNRLKKILSSV